MPGNTITESTKDVLGELRALTMTKAWKQKWPDKEIKRIDKTVDSRTYDATAYRLERKGFDPIDMTNISPEERRILTGGRVWELWARPLSQKIAEDARKPKRKKAGDADEEITEVTASDFTDN